MKECNMLNIWNFKLKTGKNANLNHKKMRSLRNQNYVPQKIFQPGVIRNSQDYEI